MANHRTPDRPEVMAALEGKESVDRRRSETLAVGFRYVALPIHHDDAIVGAVRVAMPIVAILESQAVVRDAILWASLISIVGFALLGLLITWIWYAPLKSLTLAARDIASGDLSRRAVVSGSEELVQLGEALNTMRDHMARQIETITRQREDLEQVVTGLREGVIALDVYGRITLMNRAAHTLLAPEAKETVGHRLQEVVRVSAIVEACSEATATHRAVTRTVEVDVGGRRLHMDVHATALGGQPRQRSGMLVVVRDVTALVRTAAMKAEFVANASHELRTPLATIRGAVEALESTDPADRETFAKVMAMLQRHVTRLEDLTLDLLNLHAVETAKRDLAREALASGSLCEWVSTQFAEVAAEKGVTLECAAPEHEVQVVTDRRLLELVLQNLLDNAVKFTPQGGRVTFTMERVEAATRFRVTDTGRGIRPEDQSRVFERFYQADIARSGEPRARGTGLGLAIVKHAAERLGASVSLESEVGRGTTVTLVLPDQPQA
jgi:PAS domain S-box-containing protein